MAEKTLQTRIINKNDDLATWNSSSLPLKTGEIALARVETTKPDGHGGFYKVPTYLMKVGDGAKTFSQLEWLAAPASDVYEWAKAQSKPGYIASEIKRGSSSVDADLTAAETAIVALQTATGASGAVANMIKTAIEALDVEDTAVEKQFVTAVSEADGKITVTRRALAAEDIPALEIAKITGLQAALDAKAVETSVTERFTATNTAVSTAQAAAEAAQKTIDDYKTANDNALAGVKATAEAATTVEEATTIADTAVSTFETDKFNPLKDRVTAVETKASTNETAITNLKNTEVKANTEAIAKLAQDIGNVANVMNFRGVSSGEVVGADIEDPKSGDVVIFGESEYVYDGSKWVKFGDASDNATAISNLQERVGAIETDLADTGWVKTGIDAAQEQADKGVADAKTANDAIAIINGGATQAGSIAKAVADATAALQTYADTAEADAIATAKGYTDTEVKKVDDKVTALDTTVSTNATTAANATKKVADDLAAYIQTNDAAVAAADAKGAQGITDAAAALKAANDLAAGQVKTNKEAIEALQTDVSDIEANYARVKNNQLVYGQGDAEMVIIFDCGGAN